MHELLLLILKNLGRNKVRTTLTALAVAVLVTICAEMTTVTSAIKKRVENDASQSKLLVTERWVMPSRIPARYVPTLTEMEGVEDWTVWCFYTGFFEESRQRTNQAVGFATRPDNIREMHAGLENLDPAIIEELKRDKTGVIVSASVMQTMNFKVGQEFTFLSSSHAGKDLRFRIVGVLPPGDWPRNFFFRLDYFQEAVGAKDYVNCVWLRTRDSKAAEGLAAQIQQDFAKRQPELKVETESAGVARFASRGEAVLSIIQLVVVILLIDMVIVLSNSISVATRERRVEMAVLKVLGFTPSLILLMVIGEATFVGGVSGFAGAGLAWACSTLAAHGLLPIPGLAETFLMFPIGADTIAWGGFIGGLVGFLGSFLPAWNVRKVKVSDVFAKIA